MIFSPGKEGKFTAQYGYSESYEDADQLDEEIRNMLLPLLNLEEGDYTDFSASVSGMMVQSYALAIVKPAEGRQEAVKQALLDFVTSEQSSMEHYLEDQYAIAKAAKVEVSPPAKWFSSAARTATPSFPPSKQRWPLKIRPCTSFTAPCFRGAGVLFSFPKRPEKASAAKSFFKIPPNHFPKVIF